MLKKVSKEPMLDHISHKSGSGIEFWFAGDLPPLLDYKGSEEAFVSAVMQGRKDCRDMGISDKGHFLYAHTDIALTAFGAHLTLSNLETEIMNAENEDIINPKQFALAKIYFAKKTAFSKIDENEKQRREELMIHINKEKLKKLNTIWRGITKQAGVRSERDLSRISNSGFAALYGLSSFTIDDLYKIHRLPKTQVPTNHMGSKELNYINLARSTTISSINKQAALKGYRKYGVDAEELEYYSYGDAKEVRSAIIEAGDILPENCPVVEKATH
jgi:hypothetical protein